MSDKNWLRSLLVKRVALVDRGANPKADIVLFKGAFGKQDPTASDVHVNAPLGAVPPKKKKPKPDANAPQSDAATGYTKSCACGFLVAKQAGGANLDRCPFCDTEILKGNPFTKASDGANAADFAYVPDKSKPSTWKLDISDATHVAGAAAALSSGGFRGQKADIPAEAVAGVKAKVRSAWLKLNPDKTADDMPASIKKADGTPCPTCDGDGTIRKGNMECPDCGGSGVMKASREEGSMTIDKDDLSEEVRKHVETLEADLADTQEKLKAAEAAAASTEDKGTEDSEDEVLKSLPEELRKRFEDTEKRATEAEAKADAEIAKRETAEGIAKAQAWKGAGVNPDEFGPKLAALTKADPEIAAEVERVLTAASEQVKESKLFEELGKGWSEGTSDPMEKLEALAKSYVEKGEAKDVPEGMTKALETSEGAELYSEYTSAKTKGV